MTSVRQLIAAALRPIVTEWHDQHEGLCAADYRDAVEDGLFWNRRCVELENAFAAGLDRIEDLCDRLDVERADACTDGDDRCSDTCTAVCAALDRIRAAVEVERAKASTR